MKSLVFIIQGANMLQKISSLLFDRFVINNKALGIQQEDGTYRTNYIQFDSKLIAKVLEKEESILIYQQQLSSDLVKWICLDFDFKEGGSLDNLVELYVHDFIEYLNKKKVGFLLEYSGRRGVHIWIFFDKVIKKAIAFELINTIYYACKNDIENNDFYAVDLYPKTFTSTGNKVGLGVKLPLSKHKKSGTYSYLIKSLDILKEHTKRTFKLTKESIENQVLILNSIKINKIEYLIDEFKLELEANDCLYSYKKQWMLSEVEINANLIINNLRKCKAYDNLFNRLFNSFMLTEEDRYILLGTFGHIKPNGIDILLQLLQYFPSYDESISRDRIKELRGYYYPPTMSYIHMRLGENKCTCCDNNKSVLQFLKEECKMDIEIDEYIYEFDIQNNSKDLVKLVIEKEKNYLRYNDEVTNLVIYNDLHNMTIFHLFELARIIDRIKMGEQVNLEIDPVIYTRCESDSKERKMVSLHAINRIVTTAIAIELSLIINTKYDSYSYNTSPYYGVDIFYSWATSWKKWNGKIKKYTDISLFEDYKLLKIDIKSFYDSIYISHVVKDLKYYLKSIGKFSKATENMLDFLVDFNGKVISKMGGGSRGVPQGPAYARIIAEFYLFITFIEIKNKYGKYDWLRYVDDLFVFSPPDGDMKNLEHEIEELLKLKSLQINVSKTRNYDSLKSISIEEKNDMYNFYDLRNELQIAEEKTYTMDIFEYEIFQQKISKFLGRKSDIDISDFNFLLSDRIEFRMRESLIKQYSKLLFCSNIGRGSVFSKLYKFIFGNEQLIKWFLKNEFFKEIPINSINLKCYFSEMFIYIKNNCRQELDGLAQNSCNYFKLIEELDIELKTSIESILRMIKDGE